MDYTIGIDLGTSAVKLLLVREDGLIEKSVSKEYPIFYPAPGFSEQNPEDWWNAVRTGIKELLTDFDCSKIRCVGCGGQMHGLVILDRNDCVIRPAILWNDGRTANEVEYLNNKIGTEKLSELTANIAFAGFTAPKLLWLKKHEPENFKHIEKIMLPKDYINYKLTGVHSSDFSDASGTLLFDVKNKKWSEEMLSVCNIDLKQMPKLFESYEVIGNVKADIGLPENVKVVAGAGDNAAAAVGTGTVGNNSCNISLGTSGTIFISTERFSVDTHNALHSFAHADGNYHLMGCMLSAASCNKWFCEEILKTKDFAFEQNGIENDKLGKNHVFFLPYLMGERSPINDTDARAMFIGMTLDTTRSNLLQAVLEGVAFALRDSFEVAKECGIEISHSTLCGGGAKSPLWRTIIANVLNVDINVPLTQEGPGYGAAMLAMVGCGIYKSVIDCSKALTGIKDTVKPNPEIASLYEKQYRKFKKIYPATKSLFKVIKE